MHGYARDWEGLPRRRGHKSLGKGPVAPLWEGTQVLSPRMRLAAGAGSGLFWELCSGVFFTGTRVPRQDPPPPCCHQGPARGPQPQPLPARAAGERGLHLLAKPVGSACRSAPGAGNQTREPGSWLCALVSATWASGSGPETLRLESGSGPLALGWGQCAPRVLSCSLQALGSTLCPGRRLAPLAAGSQRWTLPPSSASAPLAVDINISTTLWWCQPSGTSHRGALSSPPSNKLMMPWSAPGPCCLQLPRWQSLRRELRIEVGPQRSSEELQLDLKATCCFPPRTPPQEVHPISNHSLSTSKLCSSLHTDGGSRDESLGELQGSGVVMSHWGKLCRSGMYPDLKA